MGRLSPLLFVFLFLSLLARGQREDSLKRAKLITRLAEVNMKAQKNLDSAFNELDELEPKFLSIGDDNLMADFLLAKANILMNTEDHLKIIDVLRPMLSNQKKISTSKIASSYQYIGHAYKIEWVPDSALVNYIRALKLYEQAGNQRGLSLSYLALGLTYTQLGNEKLASDFYDRSLQYSTNSKIMEKHKEHISNQEVRPVSDNKILEMSLDIAKIAKEQGNDRLLGVTYTDLRKNYFALKDYNNALKYAILEREMMNKTNAFALLPHINYFIGTIYSLQGKPNLAISKLREALLKAPDSLRLHVYDGLKSNYLKVGNAEKAIASLESYVALKDSMVAKNVEASIAEITAQYQTEIQEEQIKNLKFENEIKTSRITKQQMTLFATLSGSVLCLFLGFLGYKNYRTKQELSYTQLNFKLLQTQLNPHFIFNALNEIKLNLATSEASNSAKYLTSYSKLIRSILEGSTKEFITLESDILLISKYLELQQMVNNHSFQFKVQVDKELNTRHLQIPPMLTQPFVENAVIHGVKKIENGRIDVNYFAENESVRIEISDNGKGFEDEPDQSASQLHSSLGTQIIQKRIRNYQKLYNFKIETHTETGQFTGTKVTISFPFRIN
jgi:tetratricopeptide (TPR) repeat protein